MFKWLFMTPLIFPICSRSRSRFPYLITQKSFNTHLEALETHSWAIQRDVHHSPKACIPVQFQTMGEYPLPFPLLQHMFFSCWFLKWRQTFLTLTQLSHILKHKSWWWCWCTYSWFASDFLFQSVHHQFLDVHCNELNNDDKASKSTPKTPTHVYGIHTCLLYFFFSLSLSKIHTPTYPQKHMCK